MAEFFSQGQAIEDEARNKGLTRSINQFANVKTQTPKVVFQNIIVYWINQDRS